MKSSVFWIGLMILAPLAPSQAQSLDPFAMIHALAPTPTGPVARSVAQDGSAKVALDQQLDADLDLPSIEFVVEFVDESHIITMEGMKTLRRAALAIQDDKLASSTFQVAGHYYNARQPVASLSMSSRRARSVVEHLKGFYNIAADRLIAVGYGQSRLGSQTSQIGVNATKIEFINVDAISQ